MAAIGAVYFSVRGFDCALFSFLGGPFNGRKLIICKMSGMRSESSDRRGTHAGVLLLLRNHDISFSKAGDSYLDLNCDRTLDITSDLIYSCVLDHGKTSINIKDENMNIVTRGTLKEMLEKWESEGKAQEPDQAENTISDNSDEPKTEQAEENASETEGAKEEPNETSNGNQADNMGIPVMTGTNIDTVISAAAKLGLSRMFSDEDFGHGTKMCSLANEIGGLTLDVIYSVSTKEILCGTIVTFDLLSSTEEQKDFINAMSDVLCPASDKDEVSDWVKKNVGDSAETTINGFSYEVGLGLTGNALYYAGEQNWEEWDSSFDS